LFFLRFILFSCFSLGVHHIYIYRPWHTY
jgi:hypothetical protein